MARAPIFWHEADSDPTPELFQAFNPLRNTRQASVRDMHDRHGAIQSLSAPSHPHQKHTRLVGPTVPPWSPRNHAQSRAIPQHIRSGCARSPPQRTVVAGAHRLHATRTGSLPGTHPGRRSPPWRCATDGLTSRVLVSCMGEAKCHGQKRDAGAHGSDTLQRGGSCRLR